MSSGSLALMPSPESDSDGLLYDFSDEKSEESKQVPHIGIDAMVSNFAGQLPLYTGTLR